MQLRRPSSNWKGKIAPSFAIVASLLLLVAVACGSSDDPTATPQPDPTSTTQPADTGSPGQQPGGEANAGDDVDYTPDVTFKLKTGIGEGGLVFEGVGGGIDGVENPALRVAPGDVVQITLVNGDGAEHDIAFPDFDAASEHIRQKGSSSSFVFTAGEAGEYAYYCTLPGHRAAGMEGLLVVGEKQASADDETLTVSRDPADMPGPIGDRAPETVKVEMETIEVKGKLADGTTFNYWTFDGQVPGPMVRVKEGDTVELTLKNPADSNMIHSIDLHAVTGPGGGAKVTQVPPGESRTFTFKAMKPGLYVYHCATPMVAQHIANGMYGMILVEPEGGLPEVDHEFYVMQGEIYSQEAHGKQGDLSFSVEKLLDEQPEYMVFNGSTGALTSEHPMQVKTGDTVRIYFGVGGPNKTSSFHVIGEIFDKVYNQASLTSEAVEDVQTTTVAPGGATVVEFQVEVPGDYILVDHALSRLERGLAGFIQAEGDPAPDIFKEGPAQ